MKSIGLYLNGVSSKRLTPLDDALLKNIRALQKFGQMRAAQNSFPCVLVQLARENDVAGELWKGIRRFKLRDIISSDLDANTGKSPSATSMLNSDAISDFVDSMALEASLAESTLILGGHADGPGNVLDKVEPIDRWFLAKRASRELYRPFRSDISPNWLTASELVDGLRKASVGSGKDKLGLIGFDACQVASFELASELSPYANFLVTSQLDAPQGGWDYEDWPSAVIGPSIDAEQASVGIGDSFGRTNSGGKPTTISSVDLSKIQGCSDCLRTFNELILRDPAQFSQLIAVRRSFFSMPDPTFFRKVDMLQFFEKFSDSAVVGVSDAVRNSALCLAEKLKIALSNRTWTNAAAVSAAAGKYHLSGLSISFPFFPAEFTTPWLDTYVVPESLSKFKADTLWDKVLIGLYIRATSP